ncbi:hypothetical protein VTK56DRAFT_3347 [Thermocarpiscus australiensis]
MPSQEQFDEHHPIRIFISFSESIDSPCLDVMANPFNLPNQKDQGIPRWGIVPDRKPSETKIYQWMERQILAENGSDFEAHMDKLLVCFVRRSESVLRSEGQQLGRTNKTGQVYLTLMSNLLKMRCMWKIWSCKQLFARQHPGAQRVVRLESEFASIQDSLRLFAAQALSELERRIIRDIETHVLKQDTNRVASTTRLNIDITKWLLLWQMMLIYRQSLSWTLQQEQTDAAPIPIAG